MEQRIAWMVGLAGFSLAFTFALSECERRWQLVSRYTWLSVVCGNGLVLAFLAALIPFDAWLIVVAAFAVASAPVLVRSLARQVAIERSNEPPR